MNVNNIVTYMIVAALCLITVILVLFFGCLVFGVVDTLFFNGYFAHKIKKWGEEG